MKVDRLFGVFNIEIGKDYQDNLRLSFFGKQSLKKRKVKIMLVLGMVFAVLVAVAAEVGAIKNDLAQAQPRRFPKRESCERSRSHGLRKKFSQIGVRIPAFKLELEMKVSAFESSF